MVDDVKQTIDFYTKNFAFETIMTFPETGPLDWAMIKKDTVIIMIQEKQNFIKEYPSIQQSIGGSLTFYFAIEGIDTLYNNVKNNVDVLRELQTTFYGKREFSIKDCNGYIITFAQDAPPTEK